MEPNRIVIVAPVVVEECGQPQSGTAHDPGGQVAIARPAGADHVHDPGRQHPGASEAQKRVDARQDRSGPAGHGQVGERVPGVGLAAQHRERTDDPADQRGDAADDQRHVHRRAGEEARRKEPGHDSAPDGA
jgi:hypothetical protein